ncbi:tyrosine-type recombinase/integrase [Bifidobacterium oedipodis]|uniref:Integrase n=1 Tax=Bifidobacterium oedipodis TaxID=2675322 RepID=A0A7Y0EPA2_9BIFI|nr:site-specific integrase [Bifidobacterium sp. DSM 109957]NMM93953.1 integrase [Bifidobacterium sp. DSM 109957]
MPRRHMSGVREPFRTKSGGREYWRVDITIGRLPDGKPKVKTIKAKTKTECLKRMRELESQIARYGHALDVKTTLGEQAERWLAVKRNDVKFSTYRTYDDMVHLHLAEWLHAPLAEFTYAKLQGILNGMRAHGRAGVETGPAGTVAREQLRTTLRQIFAMAVNEERLERNPAIGLKINVGEQVATRELANRREAFTVQEMEAMLRAAASWGVRDGARMWFRLLTGMRQGEIIGAVEKDLRLFDAKTMLPVTVKKPMQVTFTDEQGVERTGTVMMDATETREAKVRVGEYRVNWQLKNVPREHGCPTTPGGRPTCGYMHGGRCPQARWRVPEGTELIPVHGGLCLVTPKSHRGDSVPIIPMLANVLDTYLLEMSDVPNPHGLLFRHDDGSPISKREDTADFDQLMRESGIDPETHTGHETRNSVVTLLASQGVDMQLIQEIVRHSDVKMTEHYRKAGNAERLRAMEKLETGLQVKGIDWKP